MTNGDDQRSRFNRDVSAVKRAAAEAPVIITDRGAPAFVLMSMSDYRRLQGDGSDLVERLSMDDGIEFDPEPLHLRLRDVDL